MPLMTKSCCASQRASLDVMQTKMIFAGWGATVRGVVLTVAKSVCRILGLL